MLIDEFQNYLPAELSILRSCLFPATQSVIYVGDLRQQIRLGSIRDFTNIKETITEERNIILHKVYRNTKQILTFIRTLGYTVDIPENIKNGPLVEERIIMAAGERCAYIAALIAKNPTRHIGILCNNQSVAESVRTEVAPNEHVHVSTISEAQGIEFDIVCLVGTWEVARSDDVGSALPLPLHDAIARINKDILYIGLTRAIDELYIIGDKKLSDVVHDNEAN
jgi:superfamily I DNA/RNA helicase